MLGFRLGCGWCCVVGFLLGCCWFCVLLLGVSAWWNRGILDEVTKASFGRAVTGTAVMARSANEKKKKQSGSALSPSVGTCTQYSIDFCLAWALIGEWTSRILFPVPKGPWPRHGHAGALLRRYQARSPRIVAWARATFEQGALPSLLFLQGLVPIFTLPGYNALLAPGAKTRFGLRPVVGTTPLQFRLCSCGIIHRYLPHSPLHVGDPVPQDSDFILHFDGGAFRDLGVGGAGAILWLHNQGRLQLLSSNCIPLLPCIDLCGTSGRAVPPNPHSQQNHYQRG